jgi:membrane protein DedA with SNARE-associated domain
MFLTAGILRVPFRRFIMYDALSATVVIGVFFGLSYTFADHISAWWRWIRRAELGLTIGVVVVVLCAVTYYYVRRRRRRAAEAQKKTDGSSTSAVTHTAKKTESAA